MNILLQPGPAVMKPGQVLERTFSCLRHNLAVSFVLTAAAIMAPAIIEILLWQGSYQGMLYPSFGMGMGKEIFSSVLGMIRQGVITCAVYYGLRNQTAPLKESLMRGLSPFFPLFLIALLSGTAIGLGTLLLVVPGLIFMTLLSMAVPACVVEKKGVWASFKRSADLTQGSRIYIFALILLVGMVTVLLTFATTFVSRHFFGGNPIIHRLIPAVISIIPQTFNSVMLVVIYYDRCAAKEVSPK